MLLTQLLKLKEAKDETGHIVYNSFPAWKKAAKKAADDVWFDGDREICNAMSGEKPYKHKKTLAIGEWDGEKGTVFRKSVTESHELKTAEELEIGDTVTITGNVGDKDSTGEIVDFAKDKNFVVVKLHSGETHSYHSSDVTEAEMEPEDEDEFDKDDSFGYEHHDKEPTVKYAIKHKDTQKILSTHDDAESAHDEHEGLGSAQDEYEVVRTNAKKKDWKMNESMVGNFSIKKNGSRVQLKMHGKTIAMFQSKDWADLLAATKNRVSGSFGNFSIAPKADTFVLSNSNGKEVAVISAAEISELIDASKNLMEAKRVIYTDMQEWKDAVLDAYPELAKKMKFKGEMKGDYMTVSAEIPNGNRSYGTWDMHKENGVVLTEACLARK